MRRRRRRSGPAPPPKQTAPRAGAERTREERERAKAGGPPDLEKNVRDAVDNFKKRLAQEPAAGAPVPDKRQQYFAIAALVHAGEARPGLQLEVRDALDLQ